MIFFIFFLFSTKFDILMLYNFVWVRKMSHFNEAFINFTWVLLPVVVFLIYEVYNENINKRKNDLALEFCLLSSLYLMFRFGSFNNVYIFSIVFDFVILIFYIKEKRLSGLLISIFMIFIYYKLGLNILIFIFKLITYFIFRLLCKSKKNFLLLSYVSGFTFLIVSCFLRNIYIKLLFEYLVYYSVCYIIILFLIKAEKIIEINISYKELMRESQLRESLFKISHEIKNPIAVCKGYLDMFDVNNIDDFKKYIPIIKSEVDKTLNLLHDFSACKKVNLDLDIVDVSLLIEDITNNFKLMFDNRNIDFYVDIPDDEIYIYGDYNRLNQVFLNIIKNSIEAIDYDKKSFIRVSVDVLDKVVKVTIEDNGVGMNDYVLSKISEPFYTTKPNGTGLGVLLSNEIISAHNGSIDYESEEGVGTIVVITLPLY